MTDPDPNHGAPRRADAAAPHGAQGATIDAALVAAIDSIVEAAASARPGAVAAALLAAATEVCGVRRATLWRGLESGTGVLGAPSWVQLRSRGDVTPPPDAARSGPLDIGRFAVLEGGSVGTLVFERLPFDDGDREAREDALEALLACADTVAPGPSTALGELDALPAPFPETQRPRRSDDSDEAA